MMTGVLISVLIATVSPQAPADERELQAAIFEDVCLDALRQGFADFEVSAYRAGFEDDDETPAAGSARSLVRHDFDGGGRVALGLGPDPSGASDIAYRCSVSPVSADAAEEAITAVLGAEPTPAGEGCETLIWTDGDARAVLYNTGACSEAAWALATIPKYEN